MKAVGILILGVCVAGCMENPGNSKHEIPEHLWPEQSKREYFINKGLGEYNNRSAFLNFMDRHYLGLKAKNKSNPYPFAFEEAYIDTTKVDSTKKWFRVLVEPCFRLPYALIVEQVKNHYTYTIKVINGDCNDAGSFYLKMMPRFPDAIGTNIFLKLDSLNYWNLKAESNVGWLDGETWTYEAINHGRYNFIRQRMPQFCKNNELIALYKLVGLWKKESKIDNMLVALGKGKTGD
jgi:hypothetical protein